MDSRHESNEGSSWEHAFRLIYFCVSIIRNCLLGMGYSRFVRKCRSRRVEEFLNLSNIPGVRRTTRTECGRFGSSKRLKHKNGCKFARRSDGTRVRTNVFLLFLPRVRCWSVTTFSVYSCQISCDFHRLHERTSSNAFQTLSMHV